VNFEFTIIKRILNLTGYSNIHTTAAKILNCSVDEAKIINSMVIYGASKKNLTLKIKNSNFSSPDSIEEYLSYMKKLINSIAEFEKKLISTYLKFGYIKNYFGRIVFPKKDTLESGFLTKQSLVLVLSSAG
jgi:DNA polymerase I-like protein with 3'-5' exonuclease and polymerase domains